MLQIQAWICSPEKRSWLFFDKFQADGQWLHKNVVEWDINDTYTKMKKYVMDLKVVNDTAERCIKEIPEYANLAKDSQYQVDILLVATDHRGVFQDLRKQALR